MAIRLDRLATLYMFHPLAARRRNGRAGVPILMYHSISDASDSRHPYYQTATSPARFAEQMRFLKESGFTAVRLSDALPVLQQQRAGQKPVVITFDDGFRDFYTHALPILARHGFTASMFLPTAYIGDGRSSFNETECLTWAEVRELDAAGIEFGSHTVSHPQLSQLGFEAIEEELSRSKAAIEDKLGRQVASFSYPFAFPETVRPFVERLRHTLVDCGYQVGVSTVIGTATSSDDRLFLRRLPVNSSDDLALFSAKLEGGYDWLHGLQRLKKSIDRIAS